MHRYSAHDRWIKPLLATLAVLLATTALAQTVGGPLSAASAALAASQPAEVAAPSPRYSATDIERAFNVMDANKDGLLSRQEAAGFRNVAKHFDAADTNKDGALSLAEFGDALNRP